MMNETEISPQSIAADKEPERKVRTFRVLRRDEGTIKDVTRWDEMKNTYGTVWAPDAEDVGKQFGEGDYLLFEVSDIGSPEWCYPMRVVAEKRYRLADDDTA